VCKKLIKNSQPCGREKNSENCEGIFLTHTVDELSCI